MIALIRRERVFSGLLLSGFVVAALAYPYPQVAAWVGFLFAGYSAIANDSLQTIGTFLASNRDRRWWHLWLFIGGIFLLTSSYSWSHYDGDVSYGRLAAKGFETAPREFVFLQVAAPLFLLILTRLRIPVSTTFLLLSCFASSASGIEGVLTKSVAGYLVSFGVAFGVWLACSRFFARYFQGDAHPIWTALQWATSGLLWSVWIMQDAANIAVYLPRSLSPLEYAGFASVVFLGLGALFWMGGDRIQDVVTEKSQLIDVRPATVIDLVYALILYVFKVQSNVPMSTTWVFVGLLAGREVAMNLRGTSEAGAKQVAVMVFRDLGSVGFGLLVSLCLALAANEPFRNAFFLALQ
ncbi:MAG: hypothetical protein AAF550_05180 [Myxococcota bacterium]